MGENARRTSALRSSLTSQITGLRHAYTHAHTTYVLSGTGAVYSFDPVGSYEREACRAAGAAQSLVQPFLDNQVSLLPQPRYALYAMSDPILSRTPLAAVVAIRRLDILQEPASGGRPSTPEPPAVVRCSCYRN